jgi:CxxC motif-containing protein (DUF1111 family)
VCSSDLGRFGWKAGQPSLRAQNATALREDLGVTTSLHPEQPCAGSGATAPSPSSLSSLSSSPPSSPRPPSPGGAAPCPPLGAPYELSDADLEQLTRYTRLLEPPARRDLAEAEVVRGEQLFARFGCAACHRPELETGDVADLPELSRRRFAPYTDLLLHDLGDGLADDRPEGSATGREWRTAPLWGLGLLATVSGRVALLHDGRARTAAEAILWHGGEAQPARDAFAAAPAAARADLLRFLDSL